MGSPTLDKPQLLPDGNNWEGMGGVQVGGGGLRHGSYRAPAHVVQCLKAGAAHAPLTRRSLAQRHQPSRCRGLAGPPQPGQERYACASMYCIACVRCRADPGSGDRCAAQGFGLWAAHPKPHTCVRAHKHHHHNPRTPSVNPCPYAHSGEPLLVRPLPCLAPPPPDPKSSPAPRAAAAPSPPTPTSFSRPPPPPPPPRQIRHDQYVERERALREYSGNGTSTSSDGGGGGSLGHSSSGGGPSVGQAAAAKEVEELHRHAADMSLKEGQTIR